MVRGPDGKKVVVQYEFEKTRPALSEAEKLKELCIREPLQLEEGVCLILFRRTGWRDRVLRLTVAPDGESTLRVGLTK